MWFREIEKEKGEGRERETTKGKQTEPNQNHGLYTRLKAVVLYYSRSVRWDVVNPQSKVCHLWLGWGVRLVGIQVWGHHLNKGPLRNFAQSCLDIQVCSVGRGGQEGGEREMSGTHTVLCKVSTTVVKGLGCVTVCVYENGWANGWLPSLVTQVLKPCLMLGRGQTDLTQGWKVLEFMEGSMSQHGFQLAGQITHR